MSQQHIDAMNELLAGSDEVKTAGKTLARNHVLAWELSDGPDDGATVYWQLRFGPEGTAFALTPAADADLRYVGDWRTALTTMTRARDGETVEQPWKIEGDEDAVMATVGEQFAVSQKVATLPTTFPV
jgi:hypothetical protein